MNDQRMRPLKLKAEKNFQKLVIVLSAITDKIDSHHSLVAQANKDYALFVHVFSTDGSCSINL